ncbi:MAG: hypothetical protein MI892_15770 [Desulfobacterales bacterium]|nr:hypothetical protein [Desulfobacterales bacterium]
MTKDILYKKNFQQLLGDNFSMDLTFVLSIHIPNSTLYFYASPFSLMVMSATYHHLIKKTVFFLEILKGRISSLETSPQQ